MRNRRLRLFVAATLLLLAWSAQPARADYHHLGIVSLKGSTQCVWMSNSALASGDVVDATIRNDHPDGLPIADLTVEVRRKQSTGNPPAPGTGKVTNGGQTKGPFEGKPNQAGTGWKIDIDENAFPGSVAGNQSATVRLVMGTMGTAQDIEFCYTASYATLFGEANSTNAFALSTTTDLIRSRTDFWRSLLLAPVTNEDERSNLIRLDGTISRPAGTPPLVDVRLLDPATGEEIQGVQRSVNGDTFSIQNFRLAPGSSYDVLAIFADAYQGPSVSLMLEASFD